MSIKLDDNIVIIDEAHNIEDSLREAASVYITKYQIEEAISDLNHILNEKGYSASEETRKVCLYFVDFVRIFCFCGIIDIQKYNLI